MQEDLETARWILVPEHVARHHVEQGGEAVSVGYHRGGGGGHVSHRRAGRTRQADLDAIDAVALAQGLDPEEEVEAVDEEEWAPGVSEVFDRVLRALTEGACGMRDVALACEHRFAVSQPDSLPEMEQALVRVHDFAEAQEDESREILAALDAVPDGVDEIELPHVGLARRISWPAFTVSLQGSVPPLQVPAEVEWWVEGVSPAPHPRLTGMMADEGLGDQSERARRHHRNQPPQGWLVWAVLAAFVVAVFVCLGAR